MAAIRPSRTAWIAFVSLNALLLALIFFLLQFRAGRAELAQLNDLGAAVYPQPLPLEEISLRDQTGQPFGLDRMRGAWNLVFFGFSNCPDICPPTLSELGDFYRARPESAQPPLNVLFVSVDPADTPEVVGEYLLGFHPDFIGLSGTTENVNAFAGQLFVHTGAGAGAGESSVHGGHAPPPVRPRTSFESDFAESSVHGGHAPPADSPEGFISHSVHMGVVNPAGELVGLLRPPHRAADIAAALEKIFRRA